MNKRLYSSYRILWLLFLVLPVLVAGCSPRQAVTSPEAQATKTTVAQQKCLEKVKAPHSEASTKDTSTKYLSNKTAEDTHSLTHKDTWTISFPVNQRTKMVPKYSYPHFSIHFSPAIPKFTPPDISSNPVCKDILLKKGSQPESIDTIDFVLKKDIQFLISKPNPASAEVLFVPKPKKSESLNTHTAKKQLPDKWYDLVDLDFYQNASETLIIHFTADKPIEYQMKPLGHKNTLAIFFPRMHTPPVFTKLFRLHKFNTPVTTALVQSKDTGSLLTLVMDQNRQRQPVTINKDEKSLRLEIRPPTSVDTKKEPVQRAQQDIAYSKPEGVISDVKPSQEQVQESTLFPGMQKNYTGAQVSLDFQDADIEHVLRLLARVGDYNLILDENVQGQVSLKLDSVPWDQALDLILQQKNMGKIKRGNILRITTQDQLRKEQQSQLEEQKLNKEIAPLYTEYIQINYAKAGTLEPQIESFLSQRGQISSNERTNQLIISDTEENIQKIKRVIQKLDRSERQVLIEARIVYATDSFQRTMGIKWGGGLEYTSTYHGDTFKQGLYGTTGNIGVDSVTDQSGLAVNLPSQGTATFGLGGFISKITGSDIYTLDAQLELGESQGQVKTISSPRIVTLNNQQASVKQGTMIATKTESESGGTTTEYVEATLELSVTPQITPDNRLILDLSITDDSQVGNTENIDTKSAQTKLFVDDGQTIVLGGVQMLTQSQSKDSVPGASNIPFLGWLFKNNYKKQEKRELLIFIHPEIL
jgi:type IV pilus assembly protein PilQ